MRHPDGLFLGRAGEQGRLRRAHSRLAKLGHAGPLDAAAELERHQLHPVTDPERRDPELEDPRVHPGRIVGVDRGRPAAEHERMRISGTHLLGSHRVADELGVDPALTHAPRDQLCVLTTQIEDEDRPLFRSPLRQAHDLTDGNSAPPS